MPTYSQTGPPFNFQGRMTATQRDALVAWADKRVAVFPEEQQWWQIKAQQLRKTSALLETWASTKHDEPLSPYWKKDVWQPGPGGNNRPSAGSDQVSSVLVGEIKELLRDQLKRDDEAMFQMLNVRTMVEKCEDNAQYASTAPEDLKKLFAELHSMFGKPENQTILIDDKNDLYQGQPRASLSALDEPTPWEAFMTGDLMPGSTGYTLEGS